MFPDDSDALLSEPLDLKRLGFVPGPEDLQRVLIVREEGLDRGDPNAHGPLWHRELFQIPLLLARATFQAMRQCALAGHRLQTTP